MSALKNPKTQALAFFIVVTLIYLIASRPLEKVTDFVKLDERVYLTAGPAGLRVLDGSPQGKLSLLGAYLTDDDALAVAVKGWPAAAPSRYFAYVAASGEGVQVIDVTDPAHMTEAGRAAVGGQALDLAVWDNYLYVAAGAKGLYIYELKPDGKLSEVKDSQVKGDITLVETLEERLYALDGETLRVYWLKDLPLKPQELGAFDAGNPVHGLDLIDGEKSQQVYLAADWGGVQGLQVSKPITPTARVTISPTLTVETPGQAYDVARFDEYLFVADNRKGVRLYDLTNSETPTDGSTSPAQPPEVKVYDTWGQTTTIWFDRSTSQIYVGDGFSGLRRLDFRLGLNAVQESALPASETLGMAYAPPYFFVAAGGRGLRVLARAPSGDLAEAALYDTQGYAWAVQARPETWQAFVADGNQFVSLGLAALYHPTPWPNLPAAPQITLMSRLPAGPDEVFQDVQLSPDRKTAYLAAGPGGVWSVNVSAPDVMLVLGKETIPGQALRLSLDGEGKYALAAGGAGGVSLLDVRSDAFPTRLQTLSLAEGDQAGPAQGVAFVTLGGRTFGYVAAGDRGLCVIPLTAAPRPEMLAPTCLGASGRATDVLVDARRSLAYVATDTKALDRYSLIDPARPVWLGKDDLGTPTRRLALFDGWVAASAGPVGLRLLNPDSAAAPPAVYDFAARVSQFVVRGPYVYAVNGPGDGPKSTHLGLTIIDASQRKNEREVSFFPSTPDTHGGAAYAVDLHPLGNPAYLADGANGLKVLDVTDPTHPRLLNTVLPSLDVRHFWVDRGDPGRGYLALGSGDVGLVDLADRYRPGLIASVKVCQASPAVWVQSYQRDYALVGCAGRGINSVAIIDRQRLEVGAPVAVTSQANHFLIYGGNLIAVPGPSGPDIIDVARPVRPVRMESFKKGSIGAITEVFPSQHFLFANRGAGIIESYYQIGTNDAFPAGKLTTDPALPPAETTFLWTAPLTGTKQAPPPLGYQIYTANNGNGLNFYRALRDPRLTQEALYEPPGPARPAEVFNVLFSDVNAGLEGFSKWLKRIELEPVAALVDWARHGLERMVKTLAERLGTKWPETGVSPRARASLNRLFWGDFVFFGLVGVLLWAGFFAQFALPVQGIGQRWQAARRLWDYLLHGHGMMARARDGVVSRPDDDAAWRGPGVILVDVTSAVVLEKRPLERAALLQLVSRPLYRLVYRLLGDLDDPPPYGLELGRLNRLRLWLQGEAPPDLQARPPERVMGPGLVFTQGNPSFIDPKWDEAALKAVDLRKQVRTTAEEVRAVTREGIEVKNKVFCVFSVSQPPDVVLVTYAGGVEAAANIRVVKTSTQTTQGMAGQTRITVNALDDELDQADREAIHDQVQAWRQTGQASRPFSPAALDEFTRPNRQPFGVQPERILAAAMAQADKNGQPKPQDWYELPEQVAVKMYLYMLAQQSYDGLYRPSDPDDFPLQRFKEDYANQMRSQGSLAFQYIERGPLAALPLPPDDQAPVDLPPTALVPGLTLQATELQTYPITLLTNPKVLRDRGIKVIRANFTEMRAVNPGVGQRFVGHWQARWEKHADRIRTQYQVDGMRIRSQARARAQIDMMRTLQDILDCGEQSREVLALRVFQALESAAADPATRQLLPAETINMLNLLQDWLTALNSAR